MGLLWGAGSLSLLPHKQAVSLPVGPPPPFFEIHYCIWEFNPSSQMCG